MKVLWIATVGLAIVGVVFGGLLARERRDVNVEVERAALRRIDAAWSQSLTEIDEFMSFVADDATMFPFHAPIASGKEAIRSFISEMQAMPGFALTWDVSYAEVSSAGDLGYTTGSFRITLADPAGTSRTEVGKYVTVWKKQANGQWKVVADIFNLDAFPAVAT